MRNLKRALSLALASIMVLGMMVVGAGAVSIDDFSDGEKIVNKEAATVLTTLNVINGKDDGSYDPEGTVTRAEMAKMICVILNGGKDPSLGSATTNTFTDTVGHWASPYIEYCTKLGIISGRGNGTFDPNGNVTGSEASKMLLAASGYQAAIEGFTGANWEISTNVRANQVGLYDGLSIAPSTELTRDSAAQMVYNTLDIKVVTYKYTLTTDGSTVSSVPELQYANATGIVNITVLEDKFGAVKVEGVVVANEFADLSSGKTNTDYAPGVIGASKDEGKTTLVITNDDDQDAYAGTETFNVSTGKDEMGRNVAIYVKAESNASKALVIGTAILTEDNKVVTDYSGDSLADVADDNDLDIPDSAVVASNYAGKAAYGKYTDPKTAGIEKLLIDFDNDGDVDYVLMNTVQFGKVTKYSTSDKGSITVSLTSGSFSADKSANVVGFEDVAKDDYVLASYMGGKLYVEKAETVTGTLEAYKNGGTPALTTKLTVDGTDYNVSAVGAITVAGDEVYPAKDLFAANSSYKAELDTDCTFYLDANGYIIARGQLEEAVYNYAYVKARDNGNATVDSRVKVVLPDGKTGTYNLSDKSAVKLANVVPGSVYAYSLANDGKDIKLTDPKGTVPGKSAIFDKGKSTIKIANAPSGEGTQYATGSTVFYYVDNDGGVTTYQGRDKAPSISASKTTTVYKNNAGTVVSVVFTGVTGKTSVGDHLFVYGKGNIASDYTLANVVLNGKDEVEKNVKIDTNSSFSADTLYTYEVNSDGYYELDAVSGEDFYSDGTVAQIYGNTIVVSGGKNPGEFVMSDKTVVIDNDGNPGTPDVSFNGNINKNDTVQVLVEDDDKAVMVVITKRATSSGDNNNGGDNIVIDGDEITGTAMSAYDTPANINAELRNNNVILTGDWTNASGNALSVPTGKTLVIKGDLDATAQPLANSGTIIVTGEYEVKDNGTFVGNVQAHTLTLVNNAVATGDVTVSGDVNGASNGVLSTATGTTLKVGGNMAGGIYANGAVNVKGNVGYMITADNGASVTVGKNVTGALTLTDGNITVTGNTTGTVSMTKGNLSVGGNMTSVTTLAVPDGYTLTAGGSVTTSGKVTVIGTANITGALGTGSADIDVGSGSLAGSLTTGNVTTTGDVTVKKGDLTVNGTLGAANLTLTDGDLTVTDTATVTTAVAINGGTATMGDIAGAAVTVENAELTAGAITGAGKLTLNAPATGKSTVATVKSVTGAIVVPDKTVLNLTENTTIATGSTLAGVINADGNVSLGAAATIDATADMTVAGTYTTSANATTLNGKLTVGDADITATTGTITLSAAAAELTINGTMADIGATYITSAVAGSAVVFGSNAEITAVTGTNFKALDGTTSITNAKADYQGKTFVSDGTDFVAQS